MTKPRTSPDRELFGLLGAHPEASDLQREWNAYFEREGLDAFLDRYPTKEEQLPERLSEMFHFDRRAYIVGSRLQEAIILLLDHVEESAKAAGRVTVVLNRGGEFTGYFLDNLLPEALCKFVNWDLKN
jgi:shikimate 5-dehydrogenase